MDDENEYEEDDENEYEEDDENEYEEYDENEYEEYDENEYEEYDENEYEEDDENEYEEDDENEYEEPEALDVYQDPLTTEELTALLAEAMRQEDAYSARIAFLQAQCFLANVEVKRMNHMVGHRAVGQVLAMTMRRLPQELIPEVVEYLRPREMGRLFCTCRVGDVYRRAHLGGTRAIMFLASVRRHEAMVEAFAGGGAPDLEKVLAAADARTAAEMGLAPGEAPWDTVYIDSEDEEE